MQKWPCCSSLNTGLFSSVKRQFHTWPWHPTCSFSHYCHRPWLFDFCKCYCRCCCPASCCLFHCFAALRSPKSLSQASDRNIILKLLKQVEGHRGRREREPRSTIIFYIGISKPPPWSLAFFWSSSRRKLAILTVDWQSFYWALINSLYFHTVSKV